jgi:uncharacterized protein YndB with AHSA1/START domain
MGKMEIEVEGVPEQVWQALTSQEALRDWFNATTEIEPREGGRVCFEGTRGDQTFRYEGQIASLTPQEQIRFDLRDADGGSATLAISLRPGEDFTTVELQHDGFDENTNDDGQFWNGDELIALRDYVTGIGPTH